MNDLANVGFRLKVAQVYNTFLENELFADPDAAHVQVLQEIRDFVTNRLEILMGVKSESKQTEGLTDQDVKVLKLLVQKVLSGDEIEVPDVDESELLAQQTGVNNQAIATPLNKDEKPAKKPKKVKKTSTVIETLPDGRIIHVMNGKRFVQVFSRDGTPVWRVNPQNGEPQLDNKGQRIPVLTELVSTAPAVGGVQAPQTPQQLAAELEIAAHRSLAAMGLGG